MSRRRGSLARCSAGVLVLALAGCATTTGQRSAEDPFEPVNRAVFEFNDAVDRAVLKPVADAYVAIVPRFVRTGIGNFFANIDDLFNGINNALQNKPVDAGNDFGRVIVNTLAGVGGLFDPASEAGLERHNEDFGQTFGRWGAGPGAYLVLPILGPSSVRDAAGTALRFVADPTNAASDELRLGLLGGRVVDQRAQQLGTERVVEEAALDKYRFTRRAYLQRRRFLIYDGAPPPSTDDQD